MSMNEFEAWIQFYNLYPFDDYHRFHRPAALVASRWSGGFVELLEFLQPDRNDLTEADMNTMRTLGFTRKGG